MNKAIVAVLLVCISNLAAAPGHYRIDPEHSVLRIQLGTSGLFGFLGDDHQIEARVTKGEVVRSSETPDRSSVHLEISAASLRVLDPKLSEKDRKEVQSKMESDRVLDVTGHPTIVFDSTRVQFKGTDQLTITGNLTLRDKTRPVKVRCRLESGDDFLRVTGDAEFKQKDFGIQPVGAGLGTVKVKNEIRLTFEIYARPQP